MNPSTGHDRPAFLITIDTEGDNLWGRPREITTRNTQWLPRFQSLCERYRLRPTYLTNWEMVQSAAFREFAADLLARQAGEIGMHLHAWNSPPLVTLTDDDYHHQPYLIEYPEAVLREKVKVMTDTLEDAFGVKMLSHRAGRWGFDEVYARALVENGYTVDCSVTPHISWKPYKGNPTGTGGCDYSTFPEQPYFLDLEDISRSGTSPLLEIPMTVTTPRYSLPGRLAADLSKAVGRGFSPAARFQRVIFPTHARLVPNGRNRRVMLRLLAAAEHDGRDHVEFMLHSSEMMPGGSPNFASERSIASLYDDMEAVFDRAAARCLGQTLSEYHDRYCSRVRPEATCNAS